MISLPDDVPGFRIENVVATSLLNSELDLPSIALTLEGAEYEPERFPGLIYRLETPKTATLLFRSGKMVCTGAKSIPEVHQAINTVIKRLISSGVKVSEDVEITIQNLVASTDLGSPLNLNTITVSLGLEKVEYEPEQFPGLVYRMDVPKVVLLLFGSGKMVCTGAKKPDDVREAIINILDELRKAGLIQQ